MVHWRSRESDNILKGYKLDIQVIIPIYVTSILIITIIMFMIFFQTMIGSKAPPSILNWVFKYMHCRKVFLVMLVALDFTLVGEAYICIHICIEI